MKSKLLLSVLCMFCVVTANYAQTSASQAGIAIQGIARGENNTAIVNQPINLTFTFYYLDDSSAQKQIYIITKSLTTDAFGVFSDVIDPTAVNNALFANKVVSLKISKGDEIISDEPLRHVPYAISANNGVPTGSIMPFIGTVAPAGWALCDGKPLPNTAKDLIAMLGSTNSPNLLGLFLRGTGKASESQVGPILKTVQPESFKSHNHTASGSDSGHSHGYNDVYHTEKGSNKDVYPTVTTPYNRGSNGGTDNDNSGFEMSRTTSLSYSKISVTVNSNGDSETRPVNYGVNYIIKL